MTIDIETITAELVGDAMREAESPQQKTASGAASGAAAPPASAPTTARGAASGAAAPPASAPTTARAATLEELQAACPGATSDWLVQQLAGKATLDSARASHAATLAAEVAELKKQNAELAKQKPAARGVEPVGTQPAGGGGRAVGAEVQDEWNAKVAEHVKAGKSRQQAVAAAARENPELREQLLEAAAQQKTRIIAHRNSSAA